MAISRSKKQELLKQYDNNLSNAQAVVVIQQSGLPVNEQNRLRSEIKKAGGFLQVTKKRLFLRNVSDSDYDNIDLKDLDGSIMVLYCQNESDKMSPMKVIINKKKEYKKEAKEYTLDMIGGWMDKKWNNKTMINELATLPSKEELIAKLLWLMKYPIQSMVSVIDQIVKSRSE